MALDLQLWSAGLAVPMAELRKIEARQCCPLGPGLLGRILHRLHKVVAGGRGAVMTTHVQRQPTHERLLPQQGVEHTDHLRSLFIDRGGVKVVDRLVVIRLNRVGCGPGIFSKLGIAQQRHILDPLHRSRMQISREAGITKHREAFLQGELEPVAAGDAVTRPVMEILVADHTFDAFQLAIGGGGSIGEHQLGVENIEALVLHRAHVEMAHRHDVELIKVVFQAVALLIPEHRTLERGHRMGREGRIAGLHMQAQLHCAAAAGGELIAHLLQLTCHQGKQIGGLGEGIVPNREMAAFRQGAGVQAVAVGEEHRATGLIGLDAHAEAAEQIRAIGVKGDAAKAHRLALSGEHATTHIQPLQAGVGRGVNPHPAAQTKWLRRGLMQHQPGGLEGVGLRRQRHAIERELQQLQLHPLQLEGAGLRHRIGLELIVGLHQGLIGKQLNREVGVGDQTGGRPVIGKANGGHGRSVGLRFISWRERGWRQGHCCGSSAPPPPFCAHRQAPHPGTPQQHQARRN